MGILDTILMALAIILFVAGLVAAGFIFYVFYCFMEVFFPKRLSPEEHAKLVAEIEAHNADLRNQAKGIDISGYSCIRDIDLGIAKLNTLQANVRGSRYYSEKTTDFICQRRWSLTHNRDRALAYESLPYAPREEIHAACKLLKVPANFNGLGIQAARDLALAELDPKTLKKQKVPKGVIARAAERRKEVEAAYKLLSDYLYTQHCIPAVKKRFQLI